MKEAYLWAKVKKGLEKASNNRIFLQRHEDKFCPGIPDVSFCYEGVSGWIELKYLPKWPSKNSREIKHHTPHQKLWAKRYIESGGNYFLLLQVGNTCYLFCNGYSAENVYLEDVKKLDYKLLLYIFKYKNKGFLKDEKPNATAERC